MSAQPVDSLELAVWDSGEYILLGVFVFGFLTAALLGVFSWYCCCASPKEFKASKSVTLRWASTVPRSCF